MPNAKDYQGQERKILAYGVTGAGKSTALLTHPGKKFVYIFDPAGVETFAGYDVDYEHFVPELMGMQKKKPSQKAAKSTEFLRPDPDTYVKFERDFEQRVADGFFNDYDLIGLESLTTLLPMMLWHILDAQGRGQAAPEIQDYYYRTDGTANLVRVLNAQRKTIFCSAHEATGQDEVTKRVETGLALPPSLQSMLPLLFSEVVRMHPAVDKDGTPRFYAQMLPDKRSPLIRCSLKGVKQHEDITVDWRKPPENQGFFGLYAQKPHKSKEEIRKDTSVKMGGK